MLYTDLECKSNDEINEWLKHKQVIVETFNNHMDFTVKEGNPTKSNMFRFDGLPLSADSYSDQAIHVRKHTIERSDDWFPLHPEKFNKTDEIFYDLKDKGQLVFPRDINTTNKMLAEIYMRLDSE